MAEIIRLPSLRLSSKGSLPAAVPKVTTGGIMFKKGDKVTLLYYQEPQGQVEKHGWVVEDYDNGLLKVVRKASAIEKEVLKKAGKPEPKREVLVFNLRSTAFLQARKVG